MYIHRVPLTMVMGQSFRAWFSRLESFDEALARSAAADLAYLAEHGRGAALPTVRHRIQTSRHFPNMAEVRVLGAAPDGPVIRVLVVFHRDDTVVVLIGGDKGRLGNAWYDKAVPMADDLFDRYLEATS
jgi:hypothetical protein